MRSSLEGFFLETEQGQKQRLFLGVGRSLSNEPCSVKISPGCRVARMCLYRELQIRMGILFFEA